MNGQRKLAAVVATAAVAVLLVAGCSDDKKTTTITGPDGGKIEVNEDGSVKYTDDKGNSFQADADGDGGGTVKDSDGNEIDVDTGNGGGAKLPDDWPDELKPPKAVKLTSSMSTTANGRKSKTVVGEADASAQDVYEGAKKQLEDADYEIQGDYFTQSDTGDAGSLSAKNDKYEVSVYVGSTDGKTSITYSVTEIAESDNS